MTGLLVVLCCSPALAVTKNWIGTDKAWWYNTTMWNPAGVPAAGDDVILANPNQTVYYYNSGTSAPVFNSLTIKGGMTLYQGYLLRAYPLAS